ncbi:MAG: hypothetical protein F7C08_00755 [Desulfurococcales archaeon]|nr:hypothetical protein [Desulfurococcales archaeon]MCE4605053.1 hypothetical protein [Desulfurococcales archaeon]
MILFGSRIRRELEELLDSIPGQDPGEVALSLLELMAENAGKIGGREVDMVLEGLSRFSFIGTLCTLHMLLKGVAEDGFNNRGFRHVLGMMYRIYSEIYNASQDAIQSYFLQALGHDSRVAATGYSKSLATTLLYGRSKIRALYTIEGYPLKPGKMLAAELRKAGVQAYHVPEDFTYWVVSNSTVVVIPVYGVSGRGWMTVDMGGAILAYTASEKGVEILGLTHPLFTCRPSEDALLPHRVILTRRLKRQETTVRFSAYEHLDPSVVDKLVTPEGVIRGVDSQELEAMAENGSKRLETIVRDVIRG